MLLKARIDAPGALHHIIVLRIKCGRMFSGDQERDNFINRLADIVTETKTICFSWALIPNRAHFLLRTGQPPLTMIMSRLPTGYVVLYNRRHRRCGHLFKSGWKSATS
jgi:hypothetical protein